MQFSFMKLYICCYVFSYIPNSVVCDFYFIKSVLLEIPLSYGPSKNQLLVLLIISLLLYFLFIFYSTFIVLSFCLSSSLLYYNFSRFGVEYLTQLFFCFFFFFLVGKKQTRSPAFLDYPSFILQVLIHSALCCPGLNI